MEQVEGTETKKRSATLMLIAAIAVLTLVGGGGGWLIGTLLAPKIAAVEEARKAADAEKGTGAEGEGKAEDGLPRIPAEANGIVQLEPITTNLAYPSESWIRLEVALQFNGATDVKIAEDVHQDILAYLRTVSLQQIEGPRGFQYLKDDIQERVDLRSEGRVSKVMFRTFVIE